MQSILKDWHLAEPVRVVPGVHGEELPAVVGEGEDVDLVPADSRQSEDSIIHQSEDCIIHQSEDSIVHQSEDSIIHQSEDSIIHQSEDSIIHQSQVTCTLPPAYPSSSAPPAPGPGT